MAFASRPAVMLVSALLLAALAVVLFPQARNTVGLAEPSSAPVPASMPQPVTPPLAPEVATGEAVTNAAKLVIAPAAEPPMVAPVAAQATVAPAAMSTASAAAKPVEASGAAGLLVFKASASAWVRVSDSRGVVQFEKTLAAGETAVASGTPPLSVVVGNVAATEVLLRGQAFQMQDLNQNNVARFEVK